MHIRFSSNEISVIFRSRATSQARDVTEPVVAITGICAKRHFLIVSADILPLNKAKHSQGKHFVRSAFPIALSSAFSRPMSPVTARVLSPVKSPAKYISPVGSVFLYEFRISTAFKILFEEKEAPFGAEGIDE